MKIIGLITTLFVCVFFSSCIKDEAINSEADILTCTVAGDILKRDPIIENDKVTLMVVADANLLQQAPEFTLTPGATISPESGTVRDFTSPQTYTVTSQDGKWKKDYEVIFIIAGISNEYDFENVKIKQGATSSYDIFYENDSEGKWVMDWASGNSGFALTGSGTTPETFPTCQYDAGKVGKCAKLETKSTGSFGAGVKMPIAAGNIFMGTFNTIMAIMKPLEATQFGVPFEHVPTYLKGYYKYKAGDVFTDKDLNVIANKKDNWDVYAVFFETSETVKALNGYDRFTSPNIISIARITDIEKIVSDKWAMFYIPFVTKPGKVIDKDKLAAGKYSLTIVFTSSIDGDNFEGAVGSTLLIDQVELLYSKDN